MTVGEVAVGEAEGPMQYEWEEVGCEYRSTLIDVYREAHSEEGIRVRRYRSMGVWDGVQECECTGGSTGGST